ncbi:MAG: hypothetical protein R3E91_03660 [Chlamydiales bacterium]
MQAKSLISALIHPSRLLNHNLLGYFPPDLAKEINLLSPPVSPNFPKLLAQNEWIESMHFSWFYLPLKSLKPEIQKLFLSLLPEKKAVELSKMLSLPLEKLSYSSFMIPFLMNIFKKKILGEIDIISEDCLPASDLNPLLKLTRLELLNLIDLLGIHDLSIDLRQIVDREILKNIYSALFSEQIHFLHYCTKQPIKWIPPTLGLLRWNRSKEKLQHLLHERGLIRLGGALFDQNESLKWYLIHRLDTGRAELIQKIFSNNQNSLPYPYFKNQVIHILQRYKK